jgi:hypothetical protein
MKELPRGMASEIAGGVPPSLPAILGEQRPQSPSVPVKPPCDGPSQFPRQPDPSKTEHR